LKKQQSGGTLNSMKTTTLPALIVILLLPANMLFAQWEAVVFSDANGIYAASSELEKPKNPMDFGPYSPVNLFDGNLETSWVEGENGSGIGTYVLIGRQEFLEKYLLVNNGYQESEDLFLKNNRVKDFTISLYAGFTSNMRIGQFGFEADLTGFGDPDSFTLKDEMGTQRFELSFDTADFESFMDTETRHYRDAHMEETGIRSFPVVKFEIVSVYKGSRWDDTCITEISFSDSADNNSLNPGETISAVTLTEDKEKIFVQTSEGRELLLADARKRAGDRRNLPPLVTYKNEGSTFGITRGL